MLHDCAEGVLGLSTLIRLSSPSKSSYSMKVEERLYNGDIMCLCFVGTIRGFVIGTLFVFDIIIGYH